MAEQVLALRIGHARCHTRDNTESVRNVLADLIARDYENSAKECRSQLNSFRERVNATLSATSTIDLKMAVAILPPFRVIMQVLDDAKNGVERLRDRDISREDLLLKRTLPIAVANPLQLLHQRRKELALRAMVDLVREAREYFHLLESLRQDAFNPEIEETNVFQKQHRFLPSYARRNVMFGYPLIGGVKQ